MKKTILIIEDNPSQAEMLKRLVLEVNENAVVYCAGKSGDAYRILMEKTVDVFMTDIILEPSIPGDLSGIRLVEKVRQIPKYMFTPVIFITSMEDESGYAYKDLNCLGYVEKPFLPDRIKELTAKAMNYSTEREKNITICFRKDGVIYPIKEKQILYIENTSHMILIHCRDQKVKEFPYMTCRQILEEADCERLVQCSRNTIVNKEYIESLDLCNRYITLKDNGGKVEIGITYKNKICMEFEL